MSDVFAVLIHWHDANSVVRRHYANHSCRCNSVAVFCFGVFADECLWRSGVRSTYPNSARKFAKGWIRVRLKGEALARCTDGTRGKEYVHFTEDGFRDNRAGACCVAKSTGRTVVWNDIHSLSDSTRKVHIYIYVLHMEKYLRLSGCTSLLFRYANGESGEKGRGRMRRRKRQIRERRTSQRFDCAVKALHSNYLQTSMGFSLQFRFVFKKWRRNEFSRRERDKSSFFLERNRSAERWFLFL